LCYHNWVESAQARGWYPRRRSGEAGPRPEPDASDFDHGWCAPRPEAGCSPSVSCVALRAILWQTYT